MNSPASAPLIVRKTGLVGGLVCALILVLSWFGLFSSLLLGHGALPWDAMDQFYPFSFFSSQSLRSGQWPWWNPYVMLGYPQVGDPQGMVFSPLLVALMALRPKPGLLYFDWVVLLHVLVGAACFYHFLKRLAHKRMPRLLGALVFMAGGVAASRLQHVPILLSYCYFSLVLLCLERLLEKPTWRRAVLLGLTGGLFLLHLTQLTYLLLIVLVAYAVVLLCMHARRQGARYLRAACPWLLLAILIGVAIGAIQILPVLALVSVSNRASLPLEASRDASLTLGALRTLFSPNVFHALHGVYDGPADRTEAELYVGTVPLLMLIAGAAAWLISSRRRVARWNPRLCFFAVCALVSVAYFNGVNGSVFPWLFHHLPGVSLFRRPSDAAYVFNLCLVVLVVAGGDRLLNQELPRRLTVMRWLLVVALVWLAVLSVSMHDRRLNHAFAVALIPVAIGVLALLAASRSRWHAHRFLILAAGLLLVTVADFRAYNANGALTSGGKPWELQARNPSPLIGFLLAGRGAEPGALGRVRVDLDNVSAVWSNAAMVQGFYSASGYNPLRARLYDELYGYAPPWDKSGSPGRLNGQADGALGRLAGVKFVLTTSPVIEFEKRYPRGPWYQAFREGEIKVMARDDIYAPVLTPVAARVLPPAAQIDPAAFAATPFHDVVWLQAHDPAEHAAALLDAARCRNRVAIASARWRNNDVWLEVDASGGAGWVEVNDPYFPGWSASIDGHATRLYQANGMFRAVCVPPGRRTVHMSFGPVSLVQATLGRAWESR